MVFHFPISSITACEAVPLVDEAYWGNIGNTINRV